jgi:diguanylate cyclase (GGDEF)-like protein
MGGEEFVVLLPGAELDIARQVAERLRRGVEQAAMEPVGYITISLGVARWPEHGNDIEQAFKMADGMLYEAKRSGRNRVVVAQSAANQKANTTEVIGS